MADPGTSGPSGEEDQSTPKGSVGPKSAARRAAARLKARALSSQRAPKAAYKRAAETEGEAAPRGGRRPPAEETVGLSRGFPAQQLNQPIGAKHQSPLGSQAGPPGGAREQLSLPSFPSERDEAFIDLHSKPLPAEGQQEAKRRKGAPEASFTPTAVGLCPQESQGPEISDHMKILIFEAIAQGIAAGLQQRRQAAPVAPEIPQHEDQHRPSPTGLFSPALFKSLLFNAKATAGMGVEQVSDPVDPNELLFSQPTMESEEIPSPELFQEVILKQWASPSGSHLIHENERRFYTVAPDFSEALQQPTVDGPVAALVSSTILPNHEEDVLNPEERKAEKALFKVHKRAAWAIKASTAASFFNRASLMWLRQMQARVPPGDLRFHQDINKVIAATEFSADATLNASKFASRAIALSVVARRQLWLRYWKADLNHKWNLASAPYKGGKLFGEALEPLLVETKDGRKVLPSLHRPADRRGKNFRGASFRPTDRRFDAPQHQRAYTHRPDWESDGSEFKDRNREHFQGKRPFRGRGRRPFHRSK